MARTISIVGAGRVGKTLAKRLRALGWRIGAVVARTPASSRAAARAIGAGSPYPMLTDRILQRPLRGSDLNSSLREPSRSKLAFQDNRVQGTPLRGSELQPQHKAALRKGALAPDVGFTGSQSASAAILAAPVILITTPDNAMPAAVEILARAGGRAWRGKIVLHASGALDRSVLRPLARLGAATGSVHPMQTFSGRGIPKLAGVTFAIEGDARARRAARGLARSLGGIPVLIAGEDKPAYHATAVLAAGSGFPLIEAAIQMLVRIGFTRRRALQTLLPLTRQMLDNIERLGPRAAWTGPLSRGDYAVVAKHVRALRGYPREFQSAYTAVARLAGRTLSSDPKVALKRIERILKDSRRNRT
jgi:predicted short-subunit dehydrogenase-like oxidoreductase (DUF2520 family)